MVAGGYDAAAEGAGLTGGYADSSALAMSGRSEEPREALRMSDGLRARQDASPPTCHEQTVRRPGAAERAGELLIWPSGRCREAHGRVPARADHHRWARNRSRGRGQVRRSKRLRGFRRISRSHG